MKRRIIFLGILFIFIASSVFADTITLKNGEIIEGKIIERNASSVRMDVYGVTLTYFISDINKINNEEVAVTNSVETTKPTSDIVEQPVAPIVQEQAKSGDAPDESVSTSMDVNNPASQYVSKMNADLASQDPARLLEEKLKDPKFRAFILGMLGIVIFLTILFYIYGCLCLYLIAKKTAKEPAWLAWVPIGNLFLMCKIADLSYLWLLGFLAGFVPFLGIILGPIANIGLTIYFWYKIALARNKPAWVGVLMFLPIVNLVLMGYLAFSE